MEGRDYGGISLHKSRTGANLFLGLGGELRLLGGIQRSQFFGESRGLPARTVCPFHLPGDTLALSSSGALLPWHQDSSRSATQGTHCPRCPGRSLLPALLSCLSLRQSHGLVALWQVPAHRATRPTGQGTAQVAPHVPGGSRTTPHHS